MASSSSSSPCSKDNQNVFLCPLSLQEIQDPVVLVPSGITYDRKSICASLLRYPNLCPKTNVRYNQPLVYCDNVDLRAGLDKYVPYNDAEFWRVYHGIQQSWGMQQQQQQQQQQQEQHHGNSTISHIMTTDSPVSATMSSSSSSSNPSSLPTTTLSLHDTYQQVQILTFGMNKAQIDYGAALQITLSYPTDPVLMAMRASIQDAICEKQTRSAQKLYRKAVRYGIFHSAEAGCRFAQFFVATFYIFGNAGKKRKMRKNINKGRQWLEKSAAQGDASAQCYLGFLHFSVLPEENDDQAREWYGKAALQGHALGQFLLGSFYRSYGLDSYRQFGKVWTQKAALQGFDYAQHHMGLYCDVDLNDPHAAMFWYKLAADNGNKDAQFGLANLYRTGRLSSASGRDLPNASVLYTKAARRGHARAMGWLVLVKARMFLSKNKSHVL